MVEFKLDPRDGVPKLMEINPRFWGSIALAICAGADFPTMAVDLATGQRVVASPYAIGKRARWLVPGDVAHSIANPRRFALEPSFFQFFAPNLCYDEFDRHDVRGGVATVLAAAASVFDP